MKIKDLTFLQSKDLQKLRDVAEMDVVEYLGFIDAKRDNGIKINKPYFELYEKIKSDMSHILSLSSTPQASQPIVDPVKLSLESIPIDELKIHFPTEVIIVDKLKSGGIDNLGQLYGTPIDKIGRLPYIGVAALSRILSMKDAVSQNPFHYIDAWNDSLIIHELPSNYNRNFGLEQNLKNALIEYAHVIESNLTNKRYITNSQQHKTYSLLASTLKQLYIDNRSCDQIAQKEGYTHQYIEIIKGNCLSEVVGGAIFFKNYRLNQNILDLIQSLIDECLFDPIRKFEIYSGSSDTIFFRDLGLDTLDINEVTILIPKDTKGLYRSVWRIVLRTLVENPLPTDMDVLYQLIINHQDLSDMDYDTLFVEKILSCDSIVEDKGNRSIQIKNEFLTTAAQRFARIIYEATHKLTTAEVLNLYESIYEVRPTACPNVAGKYGICCEGKKYWYYGQPKMPIQQRIADYAEQEKIFFYADLEKQLLNDGYAIPHSIRAYITKVCAVDNKDRNHFCHKDYVDDYLQYNWRNPSKYGATNWIFNEINNILNEKGPIPIQDMIDQLEERSLHTDFGSVRHRIQYNHLADYTGDDKPFVVEDGNVRVNQSVIDSTDFETIGLRGEKYAYFKQIRSLVANEVKKAESGRIKLMDFIQLVNETVEDEPLSRNVIIRAIKDHQHRFSPIDVELVNEGGILYAQWTKQEIVPEPVYVISTDVDDTTDEDVLIESQQKDSRPNIKYRQTVNWKDLSDVLKSELSFFGRWMRYENLDLNEAVDLFVTLLSNSKNYELKNQLPQDLFEYWFASTDIHDRYRYLKDIILDFEAILGELYCNRYGEEPHTKGLAECATYFAGLPEMMMYSRDSKGFARIASSLLYNRNNIAHGGYLELSSLETARLIVEYVALFVYVAARYYKV